MSETPDDTRSDGLQEARQLGDVFGELRDRPTPELSSGALWHLVEARLAPRSTSRRAGWSFAAGGRAAFTMRFAYGAASIVGIALIIVWAAATYLAAPVEEARFVMLTPEMPQGMEPTEHGGGSSPPSSSGPMRLDVRLVRGWDGAPPEEVMSSTVSGAGGVDPLRDVRASIEALLPFENYGMVGAWEGPVSAGEALDIVLTDDYRLIAGSAEMSSRPSEVLRLNAVELAGLHQDSGAADLNLETKRLYILGVLAPGADAPDLVLLIRVEPMAQEG